MRRVKTLVLIGLIAMFATSAYAQTQFIPTESDVKTITFKRLPTTKTKQANALVVLTLTASAVQAARSKNQKLLEHVAISINGKPTDLALTDQSAGTYSGNATLNKALPTTSDEIAFEYPKEGTQAGKVVAAESEAKIATMASHLAAGTTGGSGAVQSPPPPPAPQSGPSGGAKGGPATANFRIYFGPCGAGCRSIIFRTHCIICIESIEW